MGYVGYGPANQLTEQGHSVPEGVTHPPVRVGYMGYSRRGPDFTAINRAAVAELPALLARWLPDGRAVGREWEACNPRRADRAPGSFRVNLRTGRWADFATGDRGGDVVSLAAFLFGLRQAQAARKLADMLGLPGGEAQHAR